MKKQFLPEDLKQIRFLSAPAASPDGRFAAYVVAQGREADGAFPGVIRLYDVQTGKDCLLTEKGHSEKQPCFLPDGRLAFLSDESGNLQVWVRDLNTGEKQQLTYLRHGLVRYSVSADGSKLAYEAVLWPEDLDGNRMFKELDAAGREAWQKELDLRPYFITELTYKMDEWSGMRKGEFSHIGWLDLTTGAAAIVDTKGMEATWPVWSRDGRHLAFYGYPHSGPKGRDAELFACLPDGSELVQLTDRDYLSPDTFPICTENDRELLFCAYPTLPDGGVSLLPFAVELETKALRQLMDADDEAVCHGVNPAVISRSVYGDSPVYLRLSRDGSTLYFLTAWQGRSRICSVPVSGTEPARLVLDGQTDVSGFALDPSDKPICIMGTLTAPGELWLDGKSVTDHNAWLRDYDLPRTEIRRITGRDDKTQLQYFLIHPVHEEPGVLYPAVLDIKGGPTTMYGAAYWHELHALSARGFAVICGNPRGSVGFGHGFCAGPICWKNEAMEDLLDMVEDAISLGFIDRARLGVTGGSYGGYMTNKLIGRTKYFKAAAAQRCLINPAVSYGTGDMGFINHGEVPKDFTMLAYLEDRARGNQITYIDNIEIPVLILHGFRDYRCGFEQAEQLFIAMKDRHPEVPVRLVMFPEENHGVTRTGKLYNQIRHLSELTDWMETYVKKGGAQNG